MSEELGVIYMWIDPDFPDDVLYVGSTLNFKQRLILHVCRAKGKRPGPFHRYVNTKYAGDWSQVDMFIIDENVPKSQLIQREFYWWMQLKARFGNCAISTHDAIKESKRKYRRDNPEKVRESNRRYSKKNRNKKREYNKLYRARKKAERA